VKSLGPGVGGIVRRESRKSEAVFLDWDVADIKRAKEAGERNGGEIITSRRNRPGAISKLLLRLPLASVG
jgi:hypothetical protein